VTGALALRFFQIDSQSLWYDEGVSAGMLGKGVVAITLAAAGDFHPPLYYYLLVGWAHLFGDSVVSLRGLTACFGVVLVVASWRLTRSLFGSVAGWLAAVWAAIAPLGVQYSQELRMYMPAAALVSVAAWCTVAWFDASETPATDRNPSVAPRWLLAGYTVAAATALYFQYVAGFGLVAIGLYGLIRTGGKRRLHWLVANAAALLLFAPWVPAFIHQMTVGQKAAESAATGVIPAVLGSWLLGTEGLPTVLGVVGVVVVALPVVAGLVCVLWTGKGGLLPTLLLVCTLGGVAAYAALRHVYEVHFILVALPAVAALAGLGASQLIVLIRRVTPPVAYRAVMVLGAALVVAVLLAADVRYLLFNPQPNDDYHGLVAQIVQQATPADAIVLYAPGQDQVFGYYYRGPNTVVGLPTQRPPDRAAVEAQLASLASSHARVWVVEYGNTEADPQGIVTNWLAQHAFLASHQWFGNVQLLLYATSATSRAGQEQPLGIHFTNGAQLVAYATNANVVHPGDTLALTLIWQADHPIAQRYTVFTHVLDGNNKVVAQHDGEPAGGVRPTTTWQPGERIEDHHGLVLPATLPLGTYTIEVGLYIPQTGQRAVTVGSAGQPAVDHILPGKITVKAAP
jgi:4-amino-4-deoxy-L-arabinose transferase-like glycosyltransferase